MTDAQRELYEWLRKQGGSGVIDRYGRVVAGGEVKPQGHFCSWLNLIANGQVAGKDGRLFIVQTGQDIITESINSMAGRHRQPMPHS